MLQLIKIQKITQCLQLAQFEDKLENKLSERKSQLQRLRVSFFGHEPKYQTSSNCQSYAIEEIPFYVLTFLEENGGYQLLC